jgi:type III secretory pathway component EscR
MNRLHRKLSRTELLWGLFVGIAGIAILLSPLLLPLGPLLENPLTLGLALGLFLFIVYKVESWSKARRNKVQ